MSWAPPSNDAQRREVGRWHDSHALDAVAVIEASKTFRKLRGHKGMPKLVAALCAHDAKLEPAVGNYATRNVA